jgi:hypothetical protein
MDAKHTPGPWHTTKFQPGEVFAENGRMRMENGGTTLYPIAKAIDFDGEMEANARLIAAAPELEAEAIGILRHFDRDNIPVNQEERPSGAGIRVFLTYRQAYRLLTAIAKARPA